MECRCQLLATHIGFSFMAELLNAMILSDRMWKKLPQSKKEKGQPSI
jgi:hypothetical protein